MTGPMNQETIVQLVLLLPVTLIASAIGVPLVGVLVRYRANYNPRVVQMDGEGGQVMSACSGPPVRGYFTMMRRVYKLEGMPGFYKGFMPTVLASLCAALVYMFCGLSLAEFKPLSVLASELGVVGTIIFVFMSFLLGLPVQILTNRAITTPYKLPSFNLRKSLRVLLSPNERRCPWILYFTPGLLAAVGLQLIVTILLLESVRLLLPPMIRSFNLSKSTQPVVALMAVWAWDAMGTTLLTPLEVITVRLTIQRNHWPGIGTDNSRTQVEEAEKEGLKEYSSEDVIALRDEQDPYLGFGDCAKRIVGEEGWRVFYRAWWVAVLVLVPGN